MVSYVIRRFLFMIPTLVVISVISFIIIQLPPGDFLSTYIAQLEQEGVIVAEHQVEVMRRQYGLDRPAHEQYFAWVRGILLRGDFGRSFDRARPVRDLIGERIGLTMLVAVSSMLLAWAISLPIGVISAVKQYSRLDHVFTFFGFLGLALPNFILALVIMYLSNRWFGTSVGGLFSVEYRDAPWSLDRVLDLLRHIWIPMFIIGTAGTAALIRVVRANLLDELRKPYVETARAKGVRKWRLIVKYPVRVALNPFFSSVAFVLPMMIGSEIIVGVVLNLPTTGPLLLRSLISQDMYLAGSFVLLLATFTVVGVFISDMILAIADPRIRLG